MDGDSFKIKNEAVQAKLHDLGQMLKGTMPPGFCFTLLLSEVGAGGAMFYISSAERDGALDSMKEFLVKQGRIPADGAIPSPFVETRVEAESAGTPGNVMELQKAATVLVKAARSVGTDSIRVLIGGVIAYGIDGAWEVIARKLQ